MNKTRNTQQKIDETYFIGKFQQKLVKHNFLNENPEYDPLCGRNYRKKSPLEVYTKFTFTLLCWWGFFRVYNDCRAGESFLNNLI